MPSPSSVFYSVPHADERITGGKLAFLFPGQGSQKLGMGKEITERYAVAKYTFAEADEALGYKISQLCWEGPENKLALTEITQPAILTVSVAVLRVLREIGIVPQCVAGHSLGEYSAHVAAGTFSFADAVRTVRKRGKYMQEAVPLGEGAMAVILGMAMGEVRKVCADAAQNQICELANINSPEQVVISGTKAAVERAMQLAKGRGAQNALLLPVSAPFHCSLMKPAKERLAADLEALSFNQPGVPVVCNVDAQFVESAEMSRDALIRQVTGEVQWSKTVLALVGRGIESFLEVGPGTVLSKLMRKIDHAKTCMNVEDETSLQKTVSSLCPCQSPSISSSGEKPSQFSR